MAQSDAHLTGDQEVMGSIFAGSGNILTWRLIAKYFLRSFSPIGLDKGGYPVNIFFLFLHENICCGYALEAPHRGASNAYPQHMFLWRNKKNINTFGLKKAPELVLCSPFR